MRKFSTSNNQRIGEIHDVHNYCRQIHHTFEQIQQLKNGRKYKFNDESTNADEDGRSIK
jgi:hypothetical protein